MPSCCDVVIRRRVAPNSKAIPCQCMCVTPAMLCAGYAFLLFQDESSVQALIDACIEEDGKLYLCVSSPTIKDKPVSGITRKKKNKKSPSLVRLWYLELKRVGFVRFRSRSARGTWTTAILWWTALSLWTRGKPSLWEEFLVRSVQVSFTSFYMYCTQMSVCNKNSQIWSEYGSNLKCLLLITSRIYSPH